jgi:hypothetical protein
LHSRCAATAPTRRREATLKRAHMGISIISHGNFTQKRSRPLHTKRPSQPQWKQESLRKLQESQDKVHHVEMGDASLVIPFTYNGRDNAHCNAIIPNGHNPIIDGQRSSMDPECIPGNGSQGAWIRYRSLLRILVRSRLQRQWVGYSFGICGMLSCWVPL